VINGTTSEIRREPLTTQFSGVVSPISRQTLSKTRVSTKGKQEIAQAPARLRYSSLPGVGRDSGIPRKLEHKVILLQKVFKWLTIELAK